MPRFVLRPLCCSLVTPQRLTGPWKPFPTVTPAMSMYCPSLKTSSGVTVLPKSLLGIFKLLCYSASADLDFACVRLLL